MTTPAEACLEHVISTGLISLGEEEGHIRVDLSFVDSLNEFTEWRANVSRGLIALGSTTLAIVEMDTVIIGGKIVNKTGASRDIEFVPNIVTQRGYKNLRNVSFKKPLIESDSGVW